MNRQQTALPRVHAEYATGGGLSPAGRAGRERVRLEAAGRFERGERTGGIAAELRVTVRSVERWRKAWHEGGAEALRSRGPVSRERLPPGQWARLERELERGPLAHGFDDDQRWTLNRVRLLIAGAFHVGYAVPGVWKLLRRHGWSCRVPVCRAVERDEVAVEVWKEQVWPQATAPRRTWAPMSASRTRRVRA